MSKHAKVCLLFQSLPVDDMSVMFHTLHHHLPSWPFRHLIQINDWNICQIHAKNELILL